MVIHEKLVGGALGVKSYEGTEAAGWLEGDELQLGCYKGLSGFHRSLGVGDL